ncbi:mCG3677, partial [Mus musculus]
KSQTEDSRRREEGFSLLWPLTNDKESKKPGHRGQVRALCPRQEAESLHSHPLRAFWCSVGRVCTFSRGPGSQPTGCLPRSSRMMFQRSQPQISHN